MPIVKFLKRKSIDLVASTDVASIEMASPMPTPGIIEASFLAGVGSATFITVAPLVTSYLGAYLACQTAGCAIATSMAGGAAGGSSATITTIGLGTAIYKVRYKQWAKENAGKYMVNRFGKLEMVPLAFITARITPLSPLALIILSNAYYFVKAYIDKKEEIQKQLMIDIE